MIEEGWDGRIIQYFFCFWTFSERWLERLHSIIDCGAAGKFTPLIRLSPPWDTLTSWWVIGVLICFQWWNSSLIRSRQSITSMMRCRQSSDRRQAPLSSRRGFDIAKVDPVLALIAGLLVAGGVHAVKSLVVRPAVTATTAGVGNVPVSIAEDVTSTLVSVLSIVVPVVIACAIVLITTIIVTRLIFKKRPPCLIKPNRRNVYEPGRTS